MMEEEKPYSLSLSERRMEKETRPLVEFLFLKSKLGKHASLVLHLLQEPVADVAGKGCQIGCPTPRALAGPVRYYQLFEMADHGPLPGVRVDTVTWSD